MSAREDVSSLKEERKSGDVTTEDNTYFRDEEGLYPVDLKDDPSLKAITVRSGIVGLIVGVLGSIIAQMFVYKPVALHVPVLFVQLVCFLAGAGLSKIPGPQWWNPGAFSTKEIGFASILAVSASIDAAAVRLLSAQDLYFDRHLSPILAISTILSSQLLGYGWAGILQPLLVYPYYTSYPSVHPSVALIRSLAGKGSIARDQLKFFKKYFYIIATYEFFPSYLAPTLQAISPWCLTLPKSSLVTQLFGGSQVMQGLGLFALCFDWATLGSYGPLYTPFDAQVTQAVGTLVAIFLFLAGYQYNWFGSGRQNGFPFMSVSLLNATGGVYDLNTIIFPNGTENKASTAKLGPPLLSVTTILGRGLALAASAASVSSVILFHFKDIKLIFGKSAPRALQEDPFRAIVKSYKSFSMSAVVSILIVSALFAVLDAHFSHSGLSVFGILVALLTSGAISIASGLIFATTGVVLSNISSMHFLGALMFPGNALSNFWFVTLSSASSKQCLNFLKDLKLGQFLLLSPMSVMTAQLVGCLVGSLTNFSVMSLILKNERDALLMPNGNGAVTGVHILKAQAAAISWGVFTQQMVTPGKIYAMFSYSAIAGLFAPVPLILLHMWKPTIGFHRFNVPVFLHGVSGFLTELTSGKMTAYAIGFWSQCYMRRYHNKWWKKYNNVLNAALSGGTEVTLLILFLFFQGGIYWKLKVPNYFLNPNGPPDHC